MVKDESQLHLLLLAKGKSEKAASRLHFDNSAQRFGFYFIIYLPLLGPDDETSLETGVRRAWAGLHHWADGSARDSRLATSTIDNSRVLTIANKLLVVRARDAIAYFAAPLSTGSALHLSGFVARRAGLGLI